jgi:hypothetical protein
MFYVDFKIIFKLIYQLMNLEFKAKHKNNQILNWKENFVQVMKS